MSKFAPLISEGEGEGSGNGHKHTVPLRDKFVLLPREQVSNCVHAQGFVVDSIKVIAFLLYKS